MEFTPTEVLPHGSAIIVLDEILACSGGSVTASVTIKESSLFLNADNRVPAWIGLEYMAQCIAAWEGIGAKRSGRAVEPGYLIGTRSYQAIGDGFLLGDRVEVTALRVQHEGPLAVFDCRIDGPHCNVRATVSVYRPPVPSALVQIRE